MYKTTVTELFTCYLQFEATFECTGIYLCVYRMYVINAYCVCLNIPLCVLSAEYLWCVLSHIDKLFFCPLSDFADCCYDTIGVQWPQDACLYGFPSV